MTVLSPAGGLTLGVGGAADDVGQLGLQAGVGGAVPARRLVAARAQRQHALQRRVGPQALALVDGQRRGVVDEESAVLDQEEASEVNVHQQRLFSALPFKDKLRYFCEGLFTSWWTAFVFDEPLARGSLAGELLRWQADGPSLRRRHGETN